MPRIITHILAVVFSISIASSTFGHVRVLSPNGGEFLEVGSTYTITWKVVTQHNHFNWDVYYSTVSDVGPWTSVALNLPPGSPFIDSVHTYDWTVPDDVNASVWVKVFMNNEAIDYDDVSDDPFSIVAALCEGDFDGSGIVDVTDLLELIGQWGAIKSTTDINADGIVDVTDLLILIGNWGVCA